MATSPLNELLARLVAHGNAMLAAATTGDWEALAAIETERRPDLAQLDILIAPLKQAGSPLPPPISARIAAILALENEMIPLVEHARNETLKELQSLDSSRRLKNLYGGGNAGNPGL